MAQSDLSAVLRLVTRIAGRAESGSDAELLQRFVARRDEVAFTALLQRHGPMIWAVCRRQVADAEDVFQAVFVVLARRAVSIRQPDRLGPWMHGVACRVAAKARQTARRRREEPLPAEGLVAPGVREPDVVWHDLRPVLDEEVNACPSVSGHLS